VNASSAVVEQRLANVGATIMGRNMFGPDRGPWRDESWRGSWGDRGARTSEARAQADPGSQRARCYSHQVRSWLTCFPPSAVVAETRATRTGALSALRHKQSSGANAAIGAVCRSRGLGESAHGYIGS